MSGGDPHAGYLAMAPGLLMRIASAVFLASGVVLIPSAKCWPWIAVGSGVALLSIAFDVGRLAERKP